MIDQNWKSVILIGLLIMLGAWIVQNLWFYFNPTATNQQASSWLDHMYQQGYFNQDTYRSLAGKTLTRAEITPYLVKFGEKVGLEQDLTRSCVFSDIGEDHSYYASITQACQYGLMKGFGKRFLPDRSMKKYELLVVLVRSQVGIIDQTSDPRYLPYLHKAQTLGILDDKIGLDQIRGDVNIDDIGMMIYMISGASR